MLGQRVRPEANAEQGRDINMSKVAQPPEALGRRLGRHGRRDELHDDLLPVIYSVTHCEG